MRIFLISTRRILRNADFVLPRFKTVAYGKHSLTFLGPQLWSKLSKEERNIGTLAAFRTTIRKKDVTSIVEGCGSECRLCLGLLDVSSNLRILIYFNMFGRCICLGSALIYAFSFKV